MSVELVKEKPPDEKQVHFLSGSTLCAKADNSDPDVDILRTDDPTFNDRDQQPSLTQATSIPITENDTSVEVNGETDAVSEAIEKRKQPLMELAYSEESYVRRLRVVYELYMPAPYRVSSNSDSTASAAVASATLPVSPSSFEELASKLPPGGPTVPDDLVARWRILWGNWVQLLEWHTGFYEKLRTLLEDDPDRIPKLFIDSRARLRSIYSKYCENQIKAAHIAEQHKEFFDEWRVHVGDKEDVVSLLMQPVQRIMRYQLPISEIVKWTERAKLSSLVLWQKALDIMKEIPKDTQLILEAARIDGFPGVITALGTLRIRGDLLVASLSRSELAEALRSYAKALNVLPSNPASRNSSGLSLLTKLHLQSSSTPEEEGEVSASTNITTTVTTTVAAPTDIGPVNFTTNEPASSLPNASTAPMPPPPPPSHQKSRSSLEVGEVFQAQPPPPLLPGGQKFVVSRLFLFDRMLLVTEEVKAKRKGTSADAFAQSTYQFRAAVNVNKMKFEPHWFMCTFTSEPVTAGSAGTGVADATPSGTAGAAVPGNEQYAGTDWPSVRAALEFAASDDLRFALWDQTPGRDVIYIIDPQTVATRSAWVVHLRDIQRMQQQLLMALEDPTRFAGGEREWGSPPAPTTEIPVLRGQAPREQLSQVPQPSSGTMNTSQQARKWPSFSMRRSGRLSSTSSALVGVATTPTSTHGPRSSASGGGAKSSKPTTLTGGGGIDGFGGSLLRSFSAERHRVVSPTPACTVDPATPTDASASSPHKPFVVRSASSPHRKESDDGSRRVPGLAAVNRVDSMESTGYDAHRNSVGFQKTKKVFTNLFFGKHSKKCRSPATTPTSGGLGALQHPILPPMAPSVLSPSVSPQSRIDSLPPPHPTVSTTTLTNATDTL